MKTVGIALIVLGASLTVLEMHSLTVYLLAAAVTCFVGSVIALLGGGPFWVVSAMTITGVVALPFAHWTRGRLKNRASEDVSKDDTGHSVTVIEAAGGVLRVAYRGSTWNARLRDSSAAVPQPGHVLVISGREGSTLLLEPPSPAT